MKVQKRGKEKDFAFPALQGKRNFGNLRGRGGGGGQVPPRGGGGRKEGFCSGHNEGNSGRNWNSGKKRGGGISASCHPFMETEIGSLMGKRRRKK